MTGRRLIPLVGALALAVAMPLQAQVYDTAVDAEHFTGERKNGSGLTGSGKYASGNQTISWEIVQNGNMFTYSYTLTGFSKPSISHFILELSGNCTPTNGCVIDPSGEGLKDGQFDTYGPGTHGKSNPGLPSTFYGVKFDTSGDPNSIFLTFISERIPVWGNIYVKGGQSGLWNTGMENLDSDNILDFIARPDTQTVVPEPATMLLLGSGLAGLGGLSARRRRRQQA